MKVLMTTDTVGGVWTYAVELCRALAPHGVEVALAAMGGLVSGSQRRQIEALSNVRLYESAYKLEWMTDPWEDVEASGRWLLEIEREFVPDIVHLNGYAHGQLPFAAPVMVVAHSCVLSWWRAVKGEEAPNSWERYKLEVTAGLRAADVVVAPTRAMLAAVGEHYGPLRQTKVIPNGRDASRYHAAHQKEHVILSAGRLWDDAKNVAALSKIACDLPWPIRVAGEDRHPDGGTASCSQVKTLGVLDESAMADQFSRAAIYALPARYEPFGLSILEAALSGCALVLGDIPSLREVWDDGAVYVRPDDTQGLRDALFGLIRFPEERAAIAHRAQARARQYTPERMAEGYFATYRSMLSSPRPCTQGRGAGGEGSNRKSQIANRKSETAPSPQPSPPSTGAREKTPEAVA